MRDAKSPTLLSKDKNSDQMGQLGSLSLEVRTRSNRTLVLLSSGGLEMINQMLIYVDNVIILYVYDMSISFVYKLRILFVYNMMILYVYNNVAS